MKHLKEKGFILDTEPHATILDTFPNPGVMRVTLHGCEFTSLCPITGQPDYATVTVKYWPKELCLESKSLKLYLGSFRNYKGFAEKITKMIQLDVESALGCDALVTTHFNSRGGISITSEAST